MFTFIHLCLIFCKINTKDNACFLIDSEEIKTNSFFLEKLKWVIVEFGAIVGMIL